MKVWNIQNEFWARGHQEQLVKCKMYEPTRPRASFIFFSSTSGENNDLYAKILFALSECQALRMIW